MNPNGTSSTSNALARVEQSASQPITDPTALTERIRNWRQDAHVLTPIMQISRIAAQHEIVPAVVLLDTTIDSSTGVGVDTYHSALFHRLPTERSLGKVALRKLLNAAGATLTTRRTDPRTTPLVWEIAAAITYRDFDGTLRTVQQTAEVDLRDGSPQLAGMKPGQVQQARRFGLRLCEAKAGNAAARDAFGLASKYTEQELQKPFVVLRTTFVPDMKDPEQRRMVAARALAGTSALYPSAARRQDDEDIIDVEPIATETPSTSTAGREPATSSSPAPAVGGPTRTGETVNTQTGEITTVAAKTEPQKPDGPLVVKVESQSGKTKDTGRAYTRYFVTLSDGRRAATFDTATALLAEKCQGEQVPVEVVIEDGKHGPTITELRRWEPGLFDGDDVSEADLNPTMKL